MDCRNCLNAKMTDGWTRIRCSKLHWEYSYNNNKEERKITLWEEELRLKRINKRKLFNMAEECADYESMD